jgi:hypothetical protein
MQKLSISALLLFFIFTNTGAWSVKQGADSVTEAISSVVRGTSKRCEAVRAAVVSAGKQTTDKKVIAAFIVGGVVVYLLLKGPEIYACLTQSDESQTDRQRCAN